MIYSLTFSFQGYIFLISAVPSLERECIQMTSNVCEMNLYERHTEFLAECSTTYQSNHLFKTKGLVTTKANRRAIETLLSKLLV